MSAPWDRGLWPTPADTTGLMPLYCMAVLRTPDQFMHRLEGGGLRNHLSFVWCVKYDISAGRIWYQ